MAVSHSYPGNKLVGRGAILEEQGADFIIEAILQALPLPLENEWTT